MIPKQGNFKAPWKTRFIAFESDASIKKKKKKNEEERWQQPGTLYRQNRGGGGVEGRWRSSANSLPLKRTSLPVKSFVYGDMIDAFDARQFENTLVERAITSFLFFTYGNLDRSSTQSGYPFNLCAFTSDDNFLYRKIYFSPNLIDI